MYAQEGKKGGTGGPVASSHRRLPIEQMYQRKAEKLLSDENCFKIFTVSLYFMIGFRLEILFFVYFSTKKNVV